MRRYRVRNFTEGHIKYFYIQDCETYEIVPLPSKFLKYKVKANRSPNTVKRLAFSICCYLEFLDEINMEITEVYDLDLERQNEHFVDFLNWLKAGNHTEKKNLKVIHNETCNAYLEDVFRFLQYVEGMDEQLGSLKVLSYNYHYAVNAVGVKKKLRFQAFKGYLKPEGRKGLISACRILISILLPERPSALLETRPLNGNGLLIRYSK